MTLTPMERANKALGGCEHSDYMAPWTCPNCRHARIAAAIAAAVQAEREALRPVTDLWQFIRENGSCMSGSDNRPCRLNDSDDPKEYCLYHMAWDIRARTGQGEG